MPYKSETDHVLLPRDKKRNVKLSLEQREEIKHLYAQGATIRGLARQFAVDKRLVQFILFPERAQKNLEDREARGGSRVHYDRAKHNAAVRATRAHRKQVLGKE